MRAFVDAAIHALSEACAWALQVICSANFWVGVATVAGTLAIALWLRRSRCSSISIGLPFNLGSATFELSAQDRVLAWRMYVQLKTRKAALPFEEEHDLVCDVYSSLYELFPIARDLLSEMPLPEIERPRGASDLIIRVLNDAVRPHLTRWQAAFRHWWEDQVKADSNKGRRPQEIQTGFPRYNELVNDLKRTNIALAKLAEDLLAFARPQRRTWNTWFSRSGRVALPIPPSLISASATMVIVGTETDDAVVQPAQPYDK